MHVNDLRRKYDALCLGLHSEAVRKTNELVDEAYDFFGSDAFNFSVVASRNIYQSRLYHNILNYLVVTKVWEGYGPVDVTVDSRALRGALEAFAKRVGIQTSVKLNRFSYIKDLLRVPVRFLRVLKKMVAIRIYAKKISCSLSEVSKSGHAILVDTYILDGSFGEKGYFNRYFGSFFDFFNEEERGRTFLVPNFLPVKSLPQVYEETTNYSRSSGFKVFCKESLVDLGDYVHIFGEWVHSFFLGFKSKDSLLFSLISEELKLRAFSEITFEAFVSFYFMKKLKTLSMPIESFLSWNENHLYTRAYAKGVAEFKLPFRHSAYQGVILDPDYDFYIKPTKTELRLHLFPEKVFIAGWDLIREFFGSDLIEAKSAPVFRLNAYLAEGRKNDDVSSVKKEREVLVGLSLVPSLSDEILEVTKKLAGMFPEYIFNVRCHPLLWKPLPEGLKNLVYDTEKSVVVSLRRSALLISTGSALILEAALMQVPTLIVRSPGERAQNPLPSKIREMYTATVDVNSDLKGQFLNCIRADLSLQREREIGSEMIYESYVKSIGRKSFEALLGR